jgi:hypothetical protein
MVFTSKSYVLQILLSTISGTSGLMRAPTTTTRKAESKPSIGGIAEVGWLSNDMPHCIPIFSPVFLVTGNQTLQLEIRHGNGCKNHGGFSN